jgi:hypothetical protein
VRDFNPRAGRGLGFEIALRFFSPLAAAWLPEFRPGEAPTGKPVGAEG